MLTSGLKVKDVMKTNVVVINADAPVKEAAKLMARHNIGSVVVIEKNEVKGILTERDIVRKMVAEEKQANIKVKDIMSHPIVVTAPDVSLETAAKIMKKNNVRRLPVIDKKGYIVGIITENDILRLLPSVLDLIEEKAAAGFFKEE
ncbi:MAG: CBS domain-containing protein [Candidatus Anstonellales archaeon]